MKKLVEGIIGIIPFTINIILILFKDPIAILFIPFSFLIGIMLCMLFCDIMMDECEKDSKEYKMWEREKNIGKVGIIAGTSYIVKSVKDATKKITDVDKWKSNI